MTPQRKLSTANLLMLAGLAPLVLATGWTWAGLARGAQNKGMVGGSDVFLMIAVLGVTYAFALVVAGASALWSRRLVRRHAGLRTRSATIVKWCVVLALLTPVLAYAALIFRMMWLAQAA